MKKVGLVTITILISLLLSGCGQKKETITCVQKAEDMEATFNIVLVDNVIGDMNIDYNANLESYSNESIEAIKKQDFCATFEESMAEYKGAFTDCKTSVENKHLNLSTKIDINKVTTNKNQKNITSQAIKEQFEKKGYSCTIK